MGKKQLKPCPFCGGEAMVCTIGFGYELYSVECTNPDCEVVPATKNFPLKRYAIEAWNKRYYEKEEKK